MKVVLLKDVKNIGRAGTIHDVSDGHALNLLIPRKLAVTATPGAMRKAEASASHEHTHKEISSKLISERLAALADGQTIITKKANEQGHLYDAVDAKDIAKATELPIEAISLEKPLKEVGTFEIPVTHGEVFGTVQISIVAE